MLITVLMLSIFAGLTGLWIYIYNWKNGQFDDEESIKYQIFRENDPDN